MTSIKKILACSLVLISTSYCAQKKEAQVNNEMPNKAVVKTVNLDLSSKGINATIQVPAGVAIIPNEYEILIGDGKSILIKIEEAYETWDQKLEFVKTNDVRGFKEFIKQSATGFIAEMNSMGMGPEFDFVHMTTIGGKIYFLQDQGSDRHKESKSIEIMYDIAETIKAKE